MERKEVLVSQADLDRQRDFEEKIKGMFTARQAHPVACVDTFGCQQNVADGQKLMGMLAECGFTRRGRFGHPEHLRRPGAR